MKPESDLSPPQKRILEILREFPGCTIQDVAKHYGCTHPTSAYHLSALVRRGHIRRSPDGRSVRHYLINGATSGEAQFVAALERDDRRKQIIAFIRNEDLENLTINQIRERLHLPYGLIKRTLMQLQKQGLVSLQPGPYTYVITLVGPWARRSGDGPVAAPLQRMPLQPRTL